MSNPYPHRFRSDDDNEYLRSVEDEEIPFDKVYCQNCQQAPCQCDAVRIEALRQLWHAWEGGTED